MDDLTAIRLSLGALGVTSGRLWKVSRQQHLMLVLPHNREVAAKTIQLYQPQRRLARLAASFLRFLISTGFYSHFLPRLELLSAGRSIISRPVNGEVGLLLGNPDHAVRRLIATYQVGDFWEVAKIAFGHEGISMLRQEADLLATLHSQLSRAPRLIGFHQSKDLAVMRMSSVEGQPLAAGEVEGVVELLDDWLSRSNAVPLPKFSEWSAICSALEECQGGSEVVRALAGCQVRSALCHGDFARWNLIRSSCGRLAVIDWEWGATDGMGGLDLVHFVCQESLLIDRLRPAEAVAEIVRQLNSPKMHAHLCRTGWGSNLLLPLIACLAFKKGAGHQNQAAVLTFAVDEFLLTR